MRSNRCGVSLLLWWTTLSDLFSLGLKSGMPWSLQKDTTSVSLPLKGLCQPPHPHSLFIYPKRCQVDSLLLFYSSCFSGARGGGINECLPHEWAALIIDLTEKCICLWARSILGCGKWGHISLMKRTNDLYSLGDSMTGLIGVLSVGRVLDWEQKFSPTSPENRGQKYGLQVQEKI